MGSLKMTKSLAGRVALVTGASRGLGRDIALKLIANGASVALLDRKAHWAEDLVQQIAANAMKDAAKQTAIDTTKNMATGLAKEALKTATGMASQFAAKGMQTMQGGAKRAAASSAGAAKKTAAAKKPAARKTTTKPAAKKGSATVACALTRSQRSLSETISASDPSAARRRI